MEALGSHSSHRSMSGEERASVPLQESGATGSRTSHMRLAVGIPTIGRPAIVRGALRELMDQTRLPDLVVICASRPEDVEGLAADPASTRIVFSTPGASRQRNAIIDAAKDCDVIVFLDDDFLMQPDYLAETEQAFLGEPALVVTTGTVIADGIGGPGLELEDGRVLLDADRKLRSTRPATAQPRDAPTFCGYGCNLAFRVEVANRHGIRFDDRLPFYSWQEDVDFSRRLGLHGKIVRLGRARGVHLGTKVGRGSGVRLGYSQIVNPLYLAHNSRGRIYPYGYALVRIVRNLSANLLRSIRPEPYIDRRGRLRGNMTALGDVLRGRLEPERAAGL
ncbi:glycosyltransferase family 2 protein [Consotaella salsifontis]|uniref:Glycosyltransferase, GT2 family n=1 Tax=Consotaella salsifontis TaxID=1365950 RepID=A0A1T4SXL8_9HYPH|nr:glycosyltransferase [Consotaella salsifontis]SKA32916.1 Glycosyltransferase, GT2 family [Consotaella salsifontis]